MDRGAARGSIWGGDWDGHLSFWLLVCGPNPQSKPRRAPRLQWGAREPETGARGGGQAAASGRSGPHRPHQTGGRPLCAPPRPAPHAGPPAPAAAGPSRTCSVGLCSRGQGFPGIPHGTVCPTSPTGSCPFFCVVPSAVASSHGKGTCRAGARIPAPPGEGGQRMPSRPVPPGRRIVSRWLYGPGSWTRSSTALLLETSGSPSTAGTTNFPSCRAPPHRPPLAPGAVGSSGWSCASLSPWQQALGPGFP